MSPEKAARPQALPSTTIELKTSGCGKIFVTVTYTEAGEIQEVFCRFGKAGGCGSAVMDGVTRVVSYALRSGMEPQLAVKALSGIECHQGKNTCLNAVAEALAAILEQLASAEGIK